MTPQSLLQQIAQIQHMERGTLCVIRQGPDGPYYNHQSWENGKNVSRYVPRDQLPALQQALTGYKQFQELVEQYVELVVQKSRAERQAGLKKRTHARAPPGPRARNPIIDKPFWNPGAQRSSGPAIGGAGARSHFQAR